MGDLGKTIEEIEAETRRLAAERRRKQFRAIDGGKADEFPIYRRLGEGEQN